MNDPSATLDRLAAHAEQLYSLPGRGHGGPATDRQPPGRYTGAEGVHRERSGLDRQDFAGGQQLVVQPEPGNLRSEPGPGAAGNQALETAGAGLQPAQRACTRASRPARWPAIGAAPSPRRWPAGNWPNASGTSPATTPSSPACCKTSASCCCCNNSARPMSDCSSACWATDLDLDALEAEAMGFYPYGPVGQDAGPLAPAPKPGRGDRRRSASGRARGLAQSHGPAADSPPCRVDCPAVGRRPDRRLVAASGAGPRLSQSPGRATARAAERPGREGPPVGHRALAAIARGPPVRGHLGRGPAATGRRGHAGGRGVAPRLARRGGGPGPGTFAGGIGGLGGGGFAGRRSASAAPRPTNNTTGRRPPPLAVARPRRRQATRRPPPRRTPACWAASGWL